MALIYRSIVNAEDPALRAAAPNLFRAWVRRKVRDNELDVPANGEPHVLSEEFEVTAIEAGDDGGALYRAQLYERRSNEEIKTTFTVLGDETQPWVWLDLERWADDAWGAVWVPFAPALLNTVLSQHRCSRQKLDTPGEYRVLTGDMGSVLARAILDPRRDLPIVVVTGTQAEARDADGAPRERAGELQRRLAGIAPVYLLGAGAVSTFSRGMLAAGDSMDVHSGAVRTYLPGAGTAGDRMSRHRFVPFAKLRNRRPEVAALIVAPPLLRAASHQSPPPVWSRLRQLPELSGGKLDDASLEELIANAGETEARALTEAKLAANERDEALEQLADAREELDELLAKLDDAERQADYAQAQLRAQGTPISAPPEEQFEPDFCEEVCDRVPIEFSLIELGSKVREGVEQLDGHVVPSWAKKALRTFRAFQGYAESKAEGFDGNLRQFCEEGHSHVIPTSWLAMQESETTDNNTRFRTLRTFPVPPEVAPSCEAYMPAHVKLEPGGNPAPRIFFHDDTAGLTGKIHIGWFGPHPDNKSKS